MLYLKGENNSMTTREEQKEQRRMDIIIAALKLFESRGYAATKISDIAESVGMSAGLLFHYFESKEKLYEEIIKIGLEGTKQPMQLDRENPIQFFEDVLSTILGAIKENPMVANMFVVMADAKRNSATPMHIKEIAMQVNNIELSVAIIEKGQQMGCIRQGDALALANLFWCTIQGIAEQAAQQPKIALPEVSWILDMLKVNEKRR